MIIWQGWGILVALIVAVFAVPGAATTGSLMQPDNPMLGAGAGVLLASVAVFFAGQKLNYPRQGFHPATGQPVIYRNTHTFFFVPMQYWAFILPVAGIAVMIASFS